MYRKQLLYKFERALQLPKPMNMSVFIYFLMGFIDWFVLYLNCDVKLYKVVLKLLKFHLGSFWYILNF